MTTATATLSKNYTKNRPIGFMTATVRAELNLAEFAWVSKKWRDYEGNGTEDCDYNVIMSLITPITNTKIWVCDRDGPDSEPMLMLPSDY